jgi:PAT family beta-lactamase induction signal transducer AmpG
VIDRKKLRHFTMRMPNLLATRQRPPDGLLLSLRDRGHPAGLCRHRRGHAVAPPGRGAGRDRRLCRLSFYLPWAFKWAFRPFIDVFTSERLGRRRGWILGTQIMLIVTLLARARA